MAYLPSLVKIQSIICDGSTSTIEFTTGITDAYSAFMLNVEQVSTPTSGQFGLQCSSTGGAPYIDSNYFSGLNFWDYNNAAWNNATTSDSFLGGPGVGSNIGVNGQIWLYGLTTNGAVKSGFGVLTDTGGTTFMIMPVLNTTDVMNALAFYSLADNLSTGSVTLYGLLR